MKKYILLASVLLNFIFNYNICSGENINYNLKKNEIYLLILDKKILNYTNKNTNVVKINEIVTIENNKNQIILKTYENGTSKINLETSEGIISINLNVTNNEAKNQDIFVLDKPEIYKNSYKIPQKGLEDIDLDMP